MLGLARVLKAYSVLANVLGGVGPIPEGMSASSALKSAEFSDKHAEIKERLVIKANEFKEKYGYTPPYWELVKLARKLPEL